MSMIICAIFVCMEYGTLLVLDWTHKATRLTTLGREDWRKRDMGSLKVFVACWDTH